MDVHTMTKKDSDFPDDLFSCFDENAPSTSSNNSKLQVANKQPEDQDDRVSIGVDRKANGRVEVTVGAKR